ncbi:hypothetical protein EXIGLDRAFT_97478 [Exidia glandulosa HHB12029]|uniref:RTA1-domain-containing protein n=1 Tax=Exidia glandulosa HHB12029 TaxID=1314781 RepID=A0A165H1R8_EXIGL|nr:hypothetical protein EXIGLDRAFT_97478 [Exidia glandulosa HHB12029]
MPDINPPNLPPPEVLHPQIPKPVVPPHVPHANYTFDASEPAALIFCVVFGLLFLLHTGQAVRYKTWWVWPLIIGLVLECEGFAFRWYSIDQLFTNWPVLIEQASLIVAPAFIAAQNYMLVGRLMSYLGKEFSPVSHTLITKIFVVSDVVSIISQGVSATLTNSKDYKTTRTGFSILIASLVFQVVMFIIFVGITIVFDKRSYQALGKARRPVKPMFIAFYISAGMIIFRSIYRTFEFSTVKFGPNQPAKGYSLDHEWLLYAFDALPITISILTLSIIHVGRYLPLDKGLRIDGTVEEPRPSRGCGCFGKRSRAAKYHSNGLPSYGNGNDSKELRLLQSTDV